MIHTFDEAKKIYEDDLIVMLDILISEELFKLKINKNNKWSGDFINPWDETIYNYCWDRLEL